MAQWRHMVQMKLFIFSSANSLSSVRWKAISWTITDLLSTKPLGTNASEIWSKMDIYSTKSQNAFENIVYKMATILLKPPCFDLSQQLSVMTYMQLTACIYLFFAAYAMKYYE